MRYKGHFGGGLLFSLTLPVIELAGRTAKGYLLISCFYAALTLASIVLFRRHVLGVAGRRIFLTLAILSGLMSIMALAMSLNGQVSR